MDWHTHVSAITVSPGHRRLGLASMMMDLLEKVGEVEKTYLFVPRPRSPSSLTSPQRRSVCPTVEYAGGVAVRVARVCHLPASQGVLRRCELKGAGRGCIR